MQTPFMMRKKIKKPITQVNIGWIANELVFANSQCSSSSSSSTVQLYLWSVVNRCAEPLAVKTWALRRVGGATSHAPHFLWLRRRGSEHRRGDVGCASAGNSTHPVPPSALVPGRKHGHDPTQIRARCWAAAMWQMTPDNGGTILLCVCVYEGEGGRNTIRERKKEFLQPCMATGWLRVQPESLAHPSCRPPAENILNLRRFRNQWAAFGRGRMRKRLLRAGDEAQRGRKTGQKNIFLFFFFAAVAFPIKVRYRYWKKEED